MLTLSDIRVFLRHHLPATAPFDGTLAKAAVLFPFIERDGTVEILLTQRTNTVEHHKGQVAFPGGMADHRDQHAEDTALREAEEEIGIPASAVEILGRTDDLVTPTGFAITPVVGILRKTPTLRLNEAEVEDAFYVPVSLFFDPSSEEVFEREWEGQAQVVYSYQFGSHRIWGVTALIIRTFLRRVAGITE